MTEKPYLTCVSYNTHRGKGPKLSYVLSQALVNEARRIELLHETRAYTYFIADWLNKNKNEFDVVGLQEVFEGAFGFGDRLFRKFRQRDHYSLIGNFRSMIANRVGFAFFRYENLLLSQLQVVKKYRVNHHLPGKMFMLASCGFTLAPFLFNNHVVWIGNTHLHSYNPEKRSKQAERIAEVLRLLGDVPIIFMGDFNTLPIALATETNMEAGDILDNYFNAYQNDTTLEKFAKSNLRLPENLTRPEYHTYPTGMPNRKLDYILFSHHWELIDYKVLDEILFSDHYPVLAKLKLIKA